MLPEIDKEKMAFSFKKAMDIYIKILKSYQGPQYPLDEESLYNFQLLKSFGMLDIFEVTKDINSNDSKAIIIFIAKNIYDRTKLKVEKPEETNKPISKWQKVMGHVKPKVIVNENKRK